MRVILAVLLLALPVAWWGLRTPPEEPSAPGMAHPTPHPGSSPASPAPRPLGNTEEEPEEGLEPSEEDAEDAFLEEDELAGPGPCIALEVTAHGAPVPNAEVSAVRLESDDIYSGLGPIRVGPEGRRQAWCKPGEYRLAAHAPGFAASMVELVVKEGGATPVARFELTSGHTLSGRVLDKDSEQPLPGAQLTVAFEDDDFSSVVPDVSITSDARGGFRLDTLATGSYRIDVQAPGHTDASLVVELPRRESLSIELEGTSRIEGQVVDAAGAPALGAKIWVSASGRMPADTEEQTDAQGRFSLEVNEGTYLLTASAAGQSGVLEGKVTVARGGLVDGLVIRLRPTGSLAGRVFVQSSQEPVKGAFVSVRHGDSGWAHSVQTEDDGGFRLENLLPGPYILALYKSGFPDARREDVRIQPGQETSVEFPLIREASLEGTVTDALGRPAEGASIVALLDQEAPNRPRGLHGVPDESGHYQISSLTPGRYHVEARVTWEGKPVSRELTLQEGETAHVDFVLSEALGQVEGSVLRASGGPPTHPVDIVAISGDINDSTAEVDEQGHFTAKLRPGSYTFTASYSDTQEEGPEQPVLVEAGKVARVTLTVPDALAETSGVVLNSRGEPVPEAEVSLEDGEELSAQAETDGQGRFTLRTAMGSAGRPVSLSARNGSEEGTLRNVRVGSQGVVVRLQKASALRGRLIAVRGPPVRSFELQVFRIEADASADRLGSRPFVGDTFEWVDLPPGTLELRARTSDGRSGKVKVQLAPGQTANVELPVGTLGRVTGRLVNSAAAPVAQWVYTDSDTPSEQAAYPSQEGRFEFIALEPGEHVLHIGSQRKLPFQVREGESLDLGLLDLSTLPMPP